jgi:hypothetical protein
MKLFLQPFFTQEIFPMEMPLLSGMMNEQDEGVINKPTLLFP